MGRCGVFVTGSVWDSVLPAAGPGRLAQELMGTHGVSGRGVGWMYRQLRRPTLPLPSFRMMYCRGPSVSMTTPTDATAKMTGFGLAPAGLHRWW